MKQLSRPGARSSSTAPMPMPMPISMPRPLSSQFLCARTTAAPPPSSSRHPYEDHLNFISTAVRHHRTITFTCTREGSSRHCLIHFHFHLHLFRCVALDERKVLLAEYLPERPSSRNILALDPIRPRFQGAYLSKRQAIA